MSCLGRLDPNDPLYGYLRHQILPQLGLPEASPDFRVYPLRASNHVYLYKDRHSKARLIGKFFGGILDRSPELACRRMKREARNLDHLRRIGFTGYPHYVPRPLGHNANLNCVLVQEFCYGTPLTKYIMRAIRKGMKEALFQKLTALAYMLATLHNRTANGIAMDFNKDCWYFGRILTQLKSCGYIGCEESQALHRLQDRWRQRRCMWEDQQVFVHGDVTPTNILLGDELWVIPVDLERMKPADRVFDVGRLAGEIKHYFMQYAGDKALAEPFIGHFLWEYSCHFPDRQRTFASVTLRVPFYLGLTLLRIARNAWVSDTYRRHLLEEAAKTLE